MTIRAHVLVLGRVQGVGFRAAAWEEARALGLAGWVRNRPDGGVELLAEGEEAAVERLVRWCHDGPAGARVTDVEVRREEARGALGGFSIR